MGNWYQQLDDKLVSFINEQQIFFTASAAANTRVNVSPKGMDTFRLIDQQTVAYLDLTGSGNETAAHIKHDGRLTIMFCGFASQCWVMRLYGRGEIALPKSEVWNRLIHRFPTLPGARQIVLLHIESIQTSCGYSVPKYEFSGQRDTLVKWTEKKGEDGIEQYRREHNSVSIDGLSTYFL